MEKASKVLYPPTSEMGRLLKEELEYLLSEYTLDNPPKPKDRLAGILDYARSFYLKTDDKLEYFTNIDIPGRKNDEQINYMRDPFVINTISNAVEKFSYIAAERTIAKQYPNIQDPIDRKQAVDRVALQYAKYLLREGQSQTAVIMKLMKNDVYFSEDPNKSVSPGQEVTLKPDNWKAGFVISKDSPYPYFEYNFSSNICRVIEPEEEPKFYHLKKRAPEANDKFYHFKKSVLNSLNFDFAKLHFEVEPDYVVPVKPLLNGRAVFELRGNPHGQMSLHLKELILKPTIKEIRLRSQDPIMSKNQNYKEKIAEIKQSQVESENSNLPSPKK